jgi:hypothetical protein
MVFWTDHDGRERSAAMPRPDAIWHWLRQRCSQESRVFIVTGAATLAILTLHALWG